MMFREWRLLTRIQRIENSCCEGRMSGGICRKDVYVFPYELFFFLKKIYITIKKKEQNRKIYCVRFSFSPCNILFTWLFTTCESQQYINSQCRYRQSLKQADLVGSLLFSSNFFFSSLSMVKQNFLSFLICQFLTNQKHVSFLVI